MQRKKSESLAIEHFIINTVKEKQPSTVDQLIQLVQKEFSMPKEEVVRHVMDLSNNGKLKFVECSLPSTPKAYILSIKAIWYWAIVTLALFTSISVFAIPENSYPFVYIRYVLGSIFVLFLPGYSLIKVLFPARELDNIERIALSIGMSLALVPTTGLFLNYTRWGIRTTPVTINLLTLTIIFATVAVILEQKAKLKENQRHIKNTSNRK